MNNGTFSTTVSTHTHTHTHTHTRITHTHTHTEEKQTRKGMVSVSKSLTHQAEQWNKKRLASGRLVISWKQCSHTCGASREPHAASSRMQPQARLAHEYSCRQIAVCIDSKCRGILQQFICSALSLFHFHVDFCRSACNVTTPREHTYLIIMGARGAGGC